MKDWTEAVVLLYFYYSYCHSPVQPGKARGKQRGGKKRLVKENMRRRSAWRMHACIIHGPISALLRIQTITICACGNTSNIYCTTCDAVSARILLTCDRLHHLTERPPHLLNSSTPHLLNPHLLIPHLLIDYSLILLNSTFSTSSSLLISSTPHLIPSSPPLLLSSPISCSPIPSGTLKFAPLDSPAGVGAVRRTGGTGGTEYH
jgi:hypothetical protein